MQPPALYLVPPPKPRRASPRTRAVLILGISSVVFSFSVAGLILGVAGFLISAPSADGRAGIRLAGRILCVAGSIASVALFGLRLGEAS